MNNIPESTGRRMWRIIYPLILYYGINMIISTIFAVSMFFKNITAEQMAQIQEGDIMLLQRLLLKLVLPYNAVITAAIALAVIPVMWLFMRADVRREYRLGTHRVYENVAPVCFAAIALLGVGACLTGNNLIRISGLLETNAEEMQQLEAATWGAGLWVELLGYGIIAPIAEELTFRGLVMKRMADYSAEKPAIIMSALVFAFYHANLVQGIYAFLLGLLLGYVYFKTRTIWGPIVMHCGANLMSTAATEIGFLDGFLESEGLFIAYVIAGALLTLAMLWVIETRVEPELLIPSAADRQEDSRTQNS